MNRKRNGGRWWMKQAAGSPEKPMTKLYHADVFIPTLLQLQAYRASYELTWTAHATKELLSDKYKAAKIPTDFFAGTFHGNDWCLIEVETTQGVPGATKYVYRRKLDAQHSIVLVLRPDGPSHARVITCWINLNHDNHKTLDRSRYATA